MWMKTKKFQKNIKKFGKALNKKLKRLMVVKKLNVGKIFKKIRFESNDYLPLNKPIKLLLLTTIVRSAFSEDSKFYPQLLLQKKLYQEIDVSEGIDVNKTSASKECELCHYWFFKDVGFKFEEHVCNRCHDLLTMAHSLKNMVILIAKGVTFTYILMGFSKNEGLKRLNNSVTYDRGVL